MFKIQPIDCIRYYSLNGSCRFCTGCWGVLCCAVGRDGSQYYGLQGHSKFGHGILCRGCIMAPTIKSLTKIYVLWPGADVLGLVSVMVSSRGNHLSVDIVVHIYTIAQVSGVLCCCATCRVGWADSFELTCGTRCMHPLMAKRYTVAVVSLFLLFLLLLPSPSPSSSSSCSSSFASSSHKARENER